MRLITGDGCEVYVPMDHLNQHKSVIPHLSEALLMVHTFGETFIKTTVDMGRIVGKSDLVKTSENDPIIFATRTGRGWPTRFAVGRESVDSQHVTVILKRAGFNKYRLVTAFVGQGAEREIGDPTIRTPREQRISEKFWETHALVWGSQEVIDASVSTL